MKNYDTLLHFYSDQTSHHLLNFVDTILKSPVTLA